MILEEIRSQYELYMKNRKPKQDKEIPPEALVRKKMSMKKK